jgi:hypothetical protein
MRFRVWRDRGMRLPSPTRLDEHEVNGSRGLLHSVTSAKAKTNNRFDGRL